MAEWSIYPCDGVEVKPCSCSDGKFTLSQNVPLNKEFVITYKNGNSTQTINYKRQTECYTCKCDKINFKWRQIEIPMSDYVKMKDNNEFSVDDHTSKYEWLGNVEVNDPTCNGKIEVVSGKDRNGHPYFTDIKIEPGTNKVLAKFGKFEQYIEVVGTEIKVITGRLLYFTFKVNNAGCKEYYISQQAWRGTDNGVSTYADNRENNHPIFLLGYSNEGEQCKKTESNICKSSNAKQCDGQLLPCTWQELSGSYEDDDSITAINGAWYHDEGGYSAITTNFEVTLGNWLKVSYQKSPNTPCTQSMIKLNALSEWNPVNKNIPRRVKLGVAIQEGYVRKASFYLTSVDDLSVDNLQPVDICPSAHVSRHPGEECALQWRYDVIQLPKGHFLCYSEEDEGNPEEYELLRLGETCGCDKLNKCNCKCQKNQSQRCD